MKSKLFASVLVGVVLLASVGVVAAAPADAGRANALTGNVTEISGSLLTVQTLAQGVVKVQTDSNTRFRMQNKGSAALSDIHLGDRIIAQGWRDGDVLHANIVRILPSNLRDVVTGLVQSINGSTIVVTKRDGSTVNVVTTSATQFHAKDNANAALSNIKVGDALEAAGELSGGTLTAAQVRFGAAPKRQTAGGPIALGQIKSVTGSALTLNTGFGGSLTVDLGSSTFIVLRGQNGPTLGSPADLTQGTGIMVIGPRSSDGTSINAIAILVGGRRSQQPESSSPLSVPQGRSSSIQPG